tara:strand:+ start:1188 stop:2312 length:1125 start_codon:yes stop_codon:yes gene_type:complete
MNVTQMHLAVQQGVDKINSLQADLLLSEEIDLELNKAQAKFINLKYGINNKYQLGFEGNQKRIDDLRVLVSEYEDIATYKEQLKSKIWVDSFRLPLDYMYLINQLTRVYTDQCLPMSWGISYPDDVYYFRVSMTDFVTNEQTQIIDQLWMFDDPQNVSGPTSYQLWDNTNSHTFPTGVAATQAEILASGTAGAIMNWQTIGHLTYPDEIIIIIDPMFYPTLTASLGTATIVGLDSLGATVSTYPLKKTQTAYSEKRVPTSTATLTLESNYSKFVQQDDIMNLLGDPFNTTKHTAPLYTVRQDQIDIYTSDIFIIDSVKLTYLRNPREISLSLGISCELPDHTHREIVDMTVSSILESIADPRYKSHEAEVNKNE